MAEQYKTTFNYLLTHQVIPQLMFSDLDFFYEKILTSPDIMQQFMQKAVAHAGALAVGKPDIEPAYPIEKFEMDIYGKGGERSDQSIIMVQLPKYEADCDCVAIAFPILRENAGYFTNELAFHPVSNEASLMLGEWAPAGESFKHKNYGVIEPSTLGRFMEMVIDIAYTDKNQPKNEKKFNDKLVDSHILPGSSDNKDAQTYYEAGTRFMNNNRLDSAEICLLEAIKRDPTFVKALDHLGIVYRRQKKYEEAEKIYLQSLALNDKNALTYTNLALVYRDLNRLEDTHKMYMKVYELDPENPESYYGMGALYQSIGEYEKSKDFFNIAIDKYIQLKSDLVYNAFYNQGGNHYELKEYKEALQCFEYAQTAYPENEYLQKCIKEINEILN